MAPLYSSNCSSDNSPRLLISTTFCNFASASSHSARRSLYFESPRPRFLLLQELFELEELDEDAVAAYQSRTPMSREEAEESLEELLNRLLDYALKKAF